MLDVFSESSPRAAAERLQKKYEALSKDEAYVLVKCVRKGAPALLSSMYCIGFEHWTQSQYMCLLDRTSLSSKSNNKSQYGTCVWLQASTAKVPIDTTGEEFLGQCFGICSQQSGRDVEPCLPS